MPTVVASPLNGERAEADTPAMSSAKPVPLLGRLAIQMKLIDVAQLKAATNAQNQQGKESKLGDVLVELGYISTAQLQKLENVQRGVLAKHRAKQVAASAGPPAAEKVAAQASSAGPELESRTPPAAVTPARAAVPAPPSSIASPAPVPATPVAAVPNTAVPNGVRSQPGKSESPSPSTPPPAPADPTPAPAQTETERLVAPERDEENESLELSAFAPGADDRERLHQLLARANEAGGSDIHIHSGAPVKIRINGVLTETDSAILSPEDTERMVMAVLSEKERLELLRYGELDSCCDVPGVGRFRTNVYRQQRGFDAVLRSVPAKPPTLEELGLPSWIAKHTNYHQGMVLITGPAGCGKSATMAAMVNLINEEREDHILCIEDPIEVVHPSKRCLVNQRHAGRHTGSFARALRAALREDPDVIVIGELRDLETISLAMTAAETGHFVLATLHTNSAVRTINRMIGAFPSNQQGQVRTMLSESLRAVISQRLVPTADETSRVAALELLVISKAIGNMIRDEKTIQIRSSIQTGSAHGMMLLEQSLSDLVRAGTITREAALELAEEKKLITGA